MKKKTGIPWLWLAYYFFFVSYATGSVLTFFSPLTGSYYYYHFLIAYNVKYLVPYCLNAGSVLFTVLTLFPLLLHILKYDLFSVDFWRVMFFARLFFDLAGHSYDVLFVKALFYQDLYAPLSLMLGTFLFLLPSYMVLFLFAFARKKGKKDTPQA